uniref:Uncharacterized protein n=2 Tax=Rhizophagus irregularis TaxID=588596 RepID=U9UQY9_RHIID
MPQTRGRSNSRKDKSSPEQFKPKRGRRRGRNNTPQEEQFLTANSGRGCGRGRGQSNKKSHLLNEILEDSDYEDTIEPSLSGPFNLLPLNNTDLEELDSALAPRPESRNLNTSTPLREVQSNELENLSAPPRLERPASRSLNTSTPLREIQSNGLELSFPSRSERPESRSLNTSTPLREIQSNGLENLSAPPRLERPASRSLNTSTPLREIQSNGLELSSPSRPGLRDLNSPASLRSFNASASSTLPSCFNDMDTIFQLATWLCANPNVLQFANAIYSSMQTSLANGQQFTSSNLTNPTKLQLQSTLHEDKSKVSRDFLEELKCLFLRVRNPPKRALEELVQQIIKCDLNSAEGLEWLRIANRQFGDFRNKFLDGIEKLVDSLKEKRKGKAVIINYTVRDLEKTKTLDIITKNLVIPSRNGSDFASNLEL